MELKDIQAVKVSNAAELTAVEQWRVSVGKNPESGFDDDYLEKPKHGYPFLLVIEGDNAYNYPIDTKVYLRVALFEEFEEMVQRNKALHSVAVLDSLEEPQAPSYYDNTHGSLYKIAQQRGWSPYTFDVVKRLDRGGKKDDLRQEINKSIFVLKLWLEELDD